MFPSNIRFVEDNLNTLSGTITRRLALMLDLDRKATDIGMELDSLRNPYLISARQNAARGSRNCSPVSQKVSPSERGPTRRSGTRRTRRSNTPSARTPKLPAKRSKSNSPVDGTLRSISDLQVLQDRIWQEKVQVGQQCLSTIENALQSVSEVSQSVAQQLLQSSTPELSANNYSTSSAGPHRTSMRTAALVASHAMHQNLASFEFTGWREGDTGSSVVSRTRKR